jgi:hypothetical protein
MSTVNPDERSRRIGTALKPLAFGLLILSIVSAPLIAVATWAIGFSDDVQSNLFIFYVLLCVGAGWLAMFVPSSRPPRLIAAYIVVYLAGLFLIMRSANPLFDDSEPVWISAVVIVVPYAVAGLLVYLYLQREAATRVTAATGVDTTATVLSAVVDGMVNYVQHQRLTLEFTDQQGVKRYLRIGRTGGGYTKGDTLPLRYDPAQPWAKRSIVIGN